MPKPNPNWPHAFFSDEANIIFKKYANLAYYFFDSITHSKITIILDAHQLGTMEEKFAVFLQDIPKLILLGISAIELVFVSRNALKSISSHKECYDQISSRKLSPVSIFKVATNTPECRKIIANHIRSHARTETERLYNFHILGVLKWLLTRYKFKKITTRKMKKIDYVKNFLPSINVLNLIIESVNKEHNLQQYRITNNHSLKQMQKIIKSEPSLSSLPFLQACSHDYVPLSDGQLRLSYLETKCANFSPYNWLMAFQIKSKINKTILEKCLQTLIRCHESLRTGINHENLTQIILKPEIADSWKLEVAYEVKNIAEFCQEFTQQKFSLTKPPLMRSILIHTTDADLQPTTYWLCTIHHSVFDGYSQTIFLKELSKLYQLAMQFPSLNFKTFLQPAEIQFADYSQWLQEVLKIKQQQQLNFWREELKDAEAVNLPTDFPRPQQKTFSGSRIPLYISQDTANAIVNLASKKNVSLYTCLLAAFQTLLHKYSLQDDICSGTMTANRKKETEVRNQLQNIIGFLANNIIIRTKFNKDMTVSDLIDQTKATIQRTIHQNSDVPFGEVVKALNPPVDNGRNPFFETLFVYQDSSYQTLNLGETSCVPIECGWGNSPFDLTLELRESAKNKLAGFFDFSTSLFSVDTIKRMAANFTTLLTEFAMHPDKRISELDYISDTEKQTLASIMKTPPTKQVYMPVNKVLEAVAQKFPNNPAVLFEDLPSCSYQELDSLANQFARFLINYHGVKPGDAVGICLKRSLELVIAILGSWKAGATIFCLETKPAESEKISHKIKITNPCKIIVQKETYNLFPKDTIDKLIHYNEGYVQLCAKESSELDKSPPPVEIKATDLAMIAFTSGTTSTNSIPKAIKIKHAGLHNWIKFYQERGHEFGILPIKKVFLSLDMAFDGGICEMICQALGHGSTLFINSEEKQYDPIALKEFFAKHQIQLAEFTPTLLSLLKPEDFPSLTHIFVIGEAFSKSLILPWLEAGKIIINGYGPTETTIGVSLFICKPDSPIYIGKPISNMRMYILDEFHRPRHIGGWGELYISGVGIADGYVNQEELTAQVFIKDPFFVGHIMYKTGDLARFAPDGNVEFKGRIKGNREIKLFGIRIQLDEIENVLLEHPNISRVTVLSIGELEKQYLAAFIITKNAEPLEYRAIQQFLIKKGLRTVKIPQVTVNLKAFPTTTNGKINLGVLPLLISLEKPNGLVQASPKNETEKKILSIWLKMFSYRQTIGVNEYYSQIGGYSIQKISLINAMNNEFFKGKSIRLALTEISECDFTIEDLADLVDQKITEKKQSLTTAVPKSVENTNKSSENSDDKSNPFSFKDFS